MKKENKQQVKPVNIKPTKQEQQGKKRLILFLSFLFLGALFVSFLVPVYYVPMFKNISSSYGLSSDIARQLTLLDLALDSLGVETPNMASAFKKYETEYEPDIFYASRFDTEGKSRLINVKETYYHEYERTHKRPAEIAGVYQDGTPVNTPVIQGKLSGVRAIPKSDFFDNTVDFDSKSSTTTANKDALMGSKRRQVRSSFDRKIIWQGQTAGGQANNNKPEPLPDFASSIYSQSGTGETQTLENSRIVKPVVDKEAFTVVKPPEHAIAKLVGDSSFTDTFSALSNFGGHEGELGYYIKDDLPKAASITNFFGDSGQNLFSSYFYSDAATRRRYDESSKHLSEIAFHGDERKDEILVAKGQKEKKVVDVVAANSPLALVLTVKRNMRECEAGRERYLQNIKPLLRDYEEKKQELRNISTDTHNVAKAGAPGSCECGRPCRPTTRLRNEWNTLIDDIMAKCIEIRQAGQLYATSCRMEYFTLANKDTCEQIQVLKVKGGTPWADLTQEPEEADLEICRRNVIWEYPEGSHSFQRCGGSEMGEDDAREDCATKQDALFLEVDNNIELDTLPGFVLSN